MYTRITLQPRDGDTPTIAFMGGGHRDIPIISLAGHPGTIVEVMLGNHPDPAGYLHELAAQLLGLADQCPLSEVVA